MPPRGPLPGAQTRRRNVRAVDVVEVLDVPFTGGPRLPRTRPDGRPWPERTRQWWRGISTMPHCVLWAESDWSFALSAAQLAAEFHDGNARIAGELHRWERVIGVTAESRARQRIRYVPVVEPDPPPSVPNLDDYRDLYG